MYSTLAGSRADVKSTTARAVLDGMRRLAVRRYRWPIYALLLVVIGCGIALSLVMERTAADIRRSTVPLLEHKIPQMRALAEFEDVVQRYQLALNKYYAESISRARFIELEHETRSEMADRLARLETSFGPGGDIDQIHSLHRHMVGMLPQFARYMSATPPDMAGLRTVLAGLNRDVKDLHRRMEDLQAMSQTSIAENSVLTERNVAGITRLVHLFNLLALLTALFMIYHIRVRFRSEDELAHQAGHDPLTGLAHRRSFERRLARLPGHPHTVVLGTLDRFSSVVRGFGHAFGDQMLKSMALRIERAAQPHGGEVFRLDGANFAVLYRIGQADPAFGAAIAALQERMRTPFSCENHEVFSSLSLGAASYPQDGARPAALLRNADAALQAARRAGGDRLAAYSQELNAEAEKRLDLETGLRHALDRGELELHYQPQQTLASGALLGFEALLRWRHKGAPVSPADFIPLAEESGLIVPIGEWVLEQACRQLAAWNAGVTPPLVMAINISPRQFSHPDFLAGVERVLAATGVDPRWVELEITEGVMMENAESAIALLHQLRRLGLKLAIDDFGTGYSSLAYLKRFPIHKLKIDQSFVRQLEAASEDVAIVQAVISLGHTLGLTVIAEGVETADQRALLQAWGCDEIQGYFYSRPLAAGAARDFIAAEPERAAAARLAPYRKLRRPRPAPGGRAAIAA